MLNHKALGQVHRITKAGHDLTSLSVSPYELSTPSPAGKFNIFIINDDVESPLGHLLSSDKRKVEFPGNPLLKY